MTTETRSLEELVALVAERRKEFAASDAEWKRRQAEFHEANESFLVERGASWELLTATERALKDAALEAYAANPANRKPAPGVEIKMFRTPRIVAPDQALDWAMEHKLFLKLDESAVKDYAKKVAIPGVVVDEGPRAQIATDLAKALGQDEGNA